jgi:hypothetical protein
VGPGVVPRQSKINDLNCQTALTAAMGVKGIFLHCKTRNRRNIARDDNPSLRARTTSGPLNSFRSCKVVMAIPTREDYRLMGMLWTYLVIRGGFAVGEADQHNDNRGNDQRNLPR